MSKRNFILLAIVLVIILVGVFAFLFSRPKTNSGTSTGGGNNFVSTFPNNTGGGTSGGNGSTSPADISGSTPDSAATQPAEKLQKVSSMPIAGYIVYTKERLKDVQLDAPAAAPDSSTSGSATSSTTTAPATSTKTKSTAKTSAPLTEFVPALKYVARATGNIYETFADKIAEQKFSQTMIPQVYEASFGDKGDSVVMRYLKTDQKTIETFVGSTPKEYLGTAIDGTAEVKGSFLPDNVQSVSISPDTGSVFYLFNSVDTMTGTILNLTTNKKTQIFSSPFTEWLSQWGASNMIALTTKPAAGISGYIYKMDASGKNMTKVAGGVSGLTTLVSPNGKLVLTGDANLSLNVYHSDTGTATTLGVRTLPEKCVWGNLSDAVYCAVPRSIPAGQYPDSWYQGVVSFSDQLWKVNVSDGSATLLLDPAAASGGADIDGIKLALDPAQNYLFFVNKKDSYLWELQLD